MCELLGMSANVPTDICFSFAGLARRGGETGPHGDGWGIAFYEGPGLRTFHDPLPSARSRIAELLISYPIKSRVVISHIRQANVGDVCLANTHPFSRELWGPALVLCPQRSGRSGDLQLAAALLSAGGNHRQRIHLLLVAGPDP